MNNIELSTDFCNLQNNIVACQNPYIDDDNRKSSTKSSVNSLKQYF